MPADVIVAASTIVAGLHGIISRVIAPTDAGVISLTYLRAGDAFNVLPNTAEIAGTIRAHDGDVMDLLKSTLELRAGKIAAGYGCTVTVDYGEEEPFVNSRGEEFFWRTYPTGYNDEELFELGMSTVEELFGTDAANRVTDAAGMGGEDFSFLGNVVPSLMVGIGHRSEHHALGERTGSNGHHPNFEMDERMLPRGAAFYASMGIRILERFIAEKDGVSDSSEL